MNNLLKFILIEDSDDDVLLLTRALKREGFQLDYQQVQSPDDLRQALIDSSWDLIISDYHLPGFEAPEALKIVQGFELDIPFIVVSGTIGEKSAVAMMKAGANDYIMKGNLTRLGEAIRREIREGQIRVERRKSEQALWKSEARNRAILAAIPDLMFRVKPDGIYRPVVADVPTAKQDIDPLSRRGRLIEAVLPANVAQQTRRVITTALQTGELQVFEQSFTLNSVAIEEEVRVIKNGPEEVLLMIRDIRDRQAALRERQRSQEQLRRLNQNLEKTVHQRTKQLRKREAQLQELSDRLTMALESASIGCWEASLKDGSLVWDQRIYEIYGIAPGTAIDYPKCLLLVHPDDRPRLEQTIEQMLRTDEDAHLEFRICRDDGTVRILKSSARVRRNQSGEPVSLVGINLDITDRKRSELALKESEEKFRQLAEAVDAVFWIVDLVSRSQVYVSPAYERIWGYPVEELYENANAWLEHLHPEDRSRLEANPAEDILEEYNEEYRIIRADGEVRWIRDRAFSIKNEQGQVYRVAGIAEDISDRKHAEAQLRQTNEQLMRATRLKDEFLASMSHELRTPLNAILGMTEALQEDVFGAVSDAQRHALQTIESSGGHLLALINDILDVAKIESGQIELNLSATAIAPLCESSLNVIKQQALSKNIELTLNLSSTVPQMLLDERRMRQVLINLLNNAVKFTPKGGHIKLQVTPLFGPPSHPTTASVIGVRWSVEDTGIGIAPEHLPKLFQPFMQIDSALNRQFEGTGLGLSLVKRLVELHGGEVGVTSQLGVGSCFTITLPLTGTNGSETGTTDPRVDEATDSQETESSALILLAEDNPANIQTLSSYLIAKGYQLRLAKDGAEAIEQAKLQQPNLILMDIQMPGVDGLEAMQRIRQQPWGLDVPIIALTALAMESDQQRCLQAGADDYISKPVKLKHLVTRIEELLQQGKIQV
ncbi:MAG: PAS domain-containing protein [Sodalinema sp.]|uniref:response regulator n=1 Tax=Sodalinema sp. TaxID=3080550 RepID=UPI00396F3D09